MPEYGQAVAELPPVGITGTRFQTPASAPVDEIFFAFSNRKCLAAVYLKIRVIGFSGSKLPFRLRAPSVADIVEYRRIKRAVFQRFEREKGELVRGQPAVRVVAGG